MPANRYERYTIHMGHKELALVHLALAAFAVRPPETRTDIGADDYAALVYLVRVSNPAADIGAVGADVSGSVNFRNWQR